MAGFAILSPLVPLKSSGDSSSAFIPWHDTLESQKARAVLQTIKDSYADSTPIGKYIRENCSHLLLEPVGDTGVKYSDMTLEAIKLNPSTFVLNSSFVPSQFPSNAGVYCVTNSDSDQYIGSALDYTRRWENHYADMSRHSYPLQKRLVSDGADSFYWTPIKDTCNYVYDITRKGVVTTLDFKDVSALQIIGQYEARLLEQSLITALEPNINGSGKVVFSFKWNPDTLYHDMTLRGDRPIVATDKSTGISVEFSSIRQAAKALDMDQRSIKGIINYEGYTRASRFDGKSYSFTEKSQPMLEGSPHYNAHLPILDTIDYNSIPLGQVWAFDSDMNKVAEFASKKAAARECGISPTSVTRGLNRVFVNSHYNGAAMLLLFAAQQLITPTSAGVIAKDVQTGETQTFPSVRSMQIALGLPQNGTFKKFYVGTGKVYKSKWVFEPAE